MNIQVPMISIGANSNITEVETSVFGYDYKNESDIKRIERLERYLYGTKKNGDIDKRLNDIKTDIDKNIKLFCIPQKKYLLCTMNSEANCKK